MIRVRTEYSDGHYSMVKYTEAHAKAGFVYSEITEDDWQGYCQWLNMSRQWQLWLQKLDNEQCDKRFNSY